MIEALVLAVGLSIGYGVQDAPQLESDAVYEVRAGGKYWVFGSYSKPSFRMGNAGQTWHHLDIVGYGIGGSFRLSDKLDLVVSAGYYDPETNADEHVANESIRNIFVSNGQIAPFHPTNYNYELDGNYGVSVGFEYEARDHVYVYGRYRALKFNQFVQMWEGDITRDYVDENPNCKCWFERNDTVDASQFEVGIGFEF